MQKKKSEQNINLPSVCLKKTETIKNYIGKSNINKTRQLDDRSIYFEMPSIHQNDCTLKTLIESQQKQFNKLQLKILKYFELLKQNKLCQQWQLYIKKSEILNNRNLQCLQIEEYLLKIIYKIILKINDINSNSFSFNRSSRIYNQSDCKINEQNYNKTMPEDRILDELSINNNKKSKILIDDKQSNNIINLTHKIVLLQKKIQLYENRIQQLNNILFKLQSKQNNNIIQKDNSSQLMQIIISKNKYKYQSQIKSIHIQTLSRDIKIYKEQSNIYKSKLNNLQLILININQQNIKLQQYLKYKQLWYMTSQQISTWRQKYYLQKQQKQRSLIKIKLLKQKNKQLLNYFNMSNAVNPDQQQDKQDLDKIIKQFKQWLMIISVPKVINHNNNLQQTQKLTNLQQVNLKLLRPNFYIFFQAFQNTLLMQKNIINIRPIEYHFFLKIRVIFDSMFKQFIISKQYKDYPSFPQFVVGFLEKYQVNYQTGKLQYRKKNIQNQQKITFLVSLFNKNFCNTWQCQIFKSFLFQNYYLDQIYFFLQCRNQFNGGIPSSNNLGSVDPISYVKLSKALKIVAKQLAPYENYIIQKVKNILKSKKKIKYGQAFIDKYFVLKILLQVYCLERAKSQRIFQSSFNLKMKKSYITFGDFHHFFKKNFSFINSIQVAQLYREVYTLSSGHVTHKAIHYICGTKGLFIPLLLQKRVNRSGIQKSLQGDMLLLDVQNVITKMVNQLQDFGQQSFMGFELSVNRFMRRLQYYKGNKALFYHKIYQQKCNILKINTLIQLASSYELNPGETMQQSQIQTRMIQLHSLLHQTDGQVHLLARQKQKRSKAWKMLVRNFKIRIQQSILQFEKVNEEQLKKLRDQIQKTNLNKQQQLEEQLKKQKS